MSDAPELPPAEPLPPVVAEPEPEVPLPPVVAAPVPVPLPPPVVVETKAVAQKPLTLAPAAAACAASINPATGQPYSTGPWGEVEHKQFMDATQQHGWGNWKMVQQNIPSRNRNQVKSHAQKFAKHHPDDKKRIIEAHATAKGLPIPVDPPPAPAPVVSAQPVAHVAPVAAPVLAAPESLPAPEAAAVELPPPEVEQHTV